LVLLLSSSSDAIVIFLLMLFSFTSFYAIIMFRHVRTTVIATVTKNNEISQQIAYDNNALKYLIDIIGKHCGGVCVVCVLFCIIILVYYPVVMLFFIIIVLIIVISFLYDITQHRF